MKTYITSPHPAFRLALLTAVIAVPLAVCAGCAGNRITLLTDAEYAEFRDVEDVEETFRAPPDPDAPEIIVDSPHLDTVQTPFDIDIKFVPSPGSRIVAETARVIYVKGFLRKDLTAKIRENARFDETGIYGPRAAIPAGKHRFLIEVADDQGRLGSTEVRVRVVER